MAVERTTFGLGRVGAGLLVGLVLAGCASAPPPSAGPYGPAAPETSPAELRPAASVLNVLALPVTLAFRLVVCAGTIVLAVPATAVLSVTDPAGTEWQRQGINEAFASNCALPW